MTAEQWWALAGLAMFGVACVVAVTDEWRRDRRTKRLAALIAAHEAGWDEWVARAPGFDETPIYSETAAWLLRTDLEDDEAVAKWLA